MIKHLVLDTRFGNWLCTWIERLTGLALCDAEFINETPISIREGGDNHA